MPNWDCSPTARHRSFTPVSLLGHYLEARVGIGRLKHRSRDKSTQFCWLHKLNTTFADVFADSASHDSKQFNEQRNRRPRDYCECDRQANPERLADRKSPQQVTVVQICLSKNRSWPEVSS